MIVGAIGIEWSTGGNTENPVAVVEDDNVVEDDDDEVVGVDFLFFLPLVDIVVLESYY